MPRVFQRDWYFCWSCEFSWVPTKFWKVLPEKYLQYIVCVGIGPMETFHKGFIGFPGAQVSKLLVPIGPGACLNMKMPSYQYRDPHVKDQGAVSI